MGNEKPKEMWGPSIMTDIQTSAIEEGNQKSSLTVTLFSSRLPRPFSGKRIIFSTNDARKTEHQHAEE